MEPDIPNPIYTVVEENLSTLSKGTKYDLAGIVNAEVKMYLQPRYNAVVFRVPLVNAEKVQFIVDVWCESREQEPRFAGDWRRLQLTVIRGAVFKRKAVFKGIDIYVFKVNTSNRDHRFIWMSDEGRDFWQAPIADPENVAEMPRFYVQRFDGANARGILNKSVGSCFGKYVSDKDKFLHSHQYVGGMFFDDWKLFMIEYKRRMTRRFIEMMLLDNQFVFDDDRDPMMHRCDFILNFGIRLYSLN